MIVYLIKNHNLQTIEIEQREDPIANHKNKTEVSYADDLEKEKAIK